LELLLSLPWVGSFASSSGRIAASHPLHHDEVFGAWWQDTFAGRHALAPDLRNSDEWATKFELCQKLVLKEHAMGGGMTGTVRNLNFAPQRFDSMATRTALPDSLLICELLVLPLPGCPGHAPAHFRTLWSFPAQSRVRSMQCGTAPEGSRDFRNMLGGEADHSLAIGRVGVRKATPQLQFCCMFVAIAVLLAYQSTDWRREKCVRERFGIKSPFWTPCTSDSDRFVNLLTGPTFAFLVYGIPTPPSRKHKTNSSGPLISIAKIDSFCCGWPQIRIPTVGDT
jgi:hypothetical protein